MRRALRKMPGAAPVGDFPGRRLRAFLAELEEVGLADDYFTFLSVRA